MVFVIFSILNVLTYSIQLTRLLVKIPSIQIDTRLSSSISRLTNVILYSHFPSRVTVFTTSLPLSFLSPNCGPINNIVDLI